MTRDNPDLPGLTEALDALADGLIVLDPDQRITFANRDAGAIAGINPAQMAGMSFAEFNAASSMNWALLAEMLEAGRTGNLMLRGEAVGAVFVTLRRISAMGPESGHVITLRDLAVLDHARRQASGNRDAVAFNSGTERRLRPDFARQRAISPWLDRMMSRGERALLQGARVIITGESGVGKTEIARHLHSFVANGADPFIAVNCAAIPESLFESELFGYEKGAFTGASTEGKKGLIEAAEGGTLFLDEIGEIPLPLQAKLLSFLEEGTILRIGGTRPRRVNVRVISATNRDLLEMAEERRFRADLYYRLAVVNMPMKPLRDVPELLDHLIDRFLVAINQRRSVPLVLSDDLRTRLRAYRYPGNIRELWNLMQQISVLGDDEEELPRRLMAVRLDGRPERDDATPAAAPEEAAADGRGLREALAEYELRIIEEAIRIHGSKRKAAAALGVDIGTISRKTRKEP
ncbi:sigma 54-interacting transcriptional regulator [Sinirhodobacter sp. WL0062]|uniref:HTH-type transcriptional regulatory protein TyrR n=1 Tax=Rhodobacter flavimaris TaxID=2907145 RepID=A0ABS8YWX6_9RHOB|nr:sigma 54-interacting transcriptional regulator [Sinirhodobacter sp. WL0062]MCE5973053.1 sigma 54-interacting transcriptional regulator [Sinirhodobacter sp. WL0062]